MKKRSYELLIANRKYKDTIFDGYFPKSKICYLCIMQ